MFRKAKNYFHLGKAFIACVMYGFPAHKLTIVGITGTDGKTTTSTLLYHILNESGRKTLLISTIGAYMHGKYFETGLHTTTPSSFEIQKLLRKAVAQGCTHAVLEITSHALDQNRAWGIPFSIGVITNVSTEHMDYHKTHKKYIGAKQKLLENADIAIVNMDDSSYATFEKALPSSKLLTYSLKDKKATLCAESFPIETSLVGDFNKQNIMAAILAAQKLGVTEEEIKHAVPLFEPPQGRQEVIYDKKFRVMIDFAHTPNAFTKILPVVREKTEGRLIHVFGAAGARDRTKRPMMGEASAAFADVIVLTAEDPRNEPLEQIDFQIEQGITGFTLIDSVLAQPKFPKSYVKINDRKSAIEYAISIAKAGDTILITGKGHEKSMNIKGKEFPWDDKNETLLAISQVKVK